MRFSKWIPFVLFVVLMWALSPVYGQTQNEVLLKGAHRLVDLQADILGDNAGNGPEGSEDPDDPDDGGWDWTITPDTTSHSVNPSPTNIYGATTLGPAVGFRKGADDPRILISLLDAWGGMQADPTINSGPDPAFLGQLYRITGDEYYKEFARDVWYSALTDIGGDPGNPRATAEVIRDARTGQGIPAIYPWDIGLFIISAKILEGIYQNNEFRPQAIAMANVVVEDLVSPILLFDISDSTQSFYDIGLIGSVISLKLTAVLPSLATDIRDMVLARQNEDGSWGWNDTYPEADFQNTAYAVLALFLYKGHPASGDARRAGSNFIAANQHANGGWDLYLDETTEVPEVNGECLLAVAAVKPTLPFAPSSKPVGHPVPLPIARPIRAADIYR